MAKAMGQDLVQGLTQEQVASLLDALLNLLDPSQMSRLLIEAEKDVHDVLIQLMEGTRPETGKVISEDKLVEEWRGLWEAWAEIVDELGDVDGNFTFQEDQGDPPYFQSDTFSEELDEVAGRMLPLLARIWESGEEEPTLFEAALDEIEEGLEDFPEYMAVEDSDCPLGPAVTRCILEWTRLSAGTTKLFLERLAHLEQVMEVSTLSPDGMVDFFQRLPEDERREIYYLLVSRREEPAWEERLGDFLSGWQRIYLELAKTFDRERYLERCSALISQDWRYGLPVLEELLQKHDALGANQAFEEIFGSLLSRSDGKAWMPEKVLLAASRISYTSSREEIIGLLTRWIGLAEGAGLTTRAKALHLQLALYQEPFNWDMGAAAFQEWADPDLMAQWKALAAGDIVPPSSAERTWVHWLLDAGLDDAKGGPWFLERTRKWLQDLKERWRSAERRALFLLTRDLAEISDLRDQFPHVVEISSRSYSVGISRLEWLKRMRGAELIPLVVDCWRAHLKALIPDPAGAMSSRYEEHALWLRAAQELDREAFLAILERWRAEYGRRRNLWSALLARGISKDEG